MYTIKVIQIYEKANQRNDLLTIVKEKRVNDIEKFRKRIIKVFSKRYKKEVLVSFSYVENLH